MVFFPTLTRRATEDDTEKLISLKVGDVQPEPMRRNPFRTLALAVGIAGLVTLISQLTGNLFATSPTSNLHIIRNRTLGFEKIYSIGLADRTHKHDAQLMAGQLTGLQITFEPGVKWQDVPGSEVSEDWHLSQEYIGSIGCWRAHMNVIAKMVEDGVSSALILEDDADWDVGIKSQLQSFAEGALALQGQASTSEHGSPYGDDWDLLWLGACDIYAPKHDNTFYVLEDDPTIPPHHRRLAEMQNFDLKQPDKRYIFRPDYGVCTTGYAISLEGARRILVANSVRLPNNAIDRRYGDMCGGHDGEAPLRCLAIFPPLLGMHRFAGTGTADSDITPHEGIWHKEFSNDIVYSTTLNIPRISWGNTTATAQWEDEMVPREMEMDKEFRIRGSIQHLGDLPV